MEGVHLVEGAGAYAGNKPMLGGGEASWGDATRIVLARGAVPVCRGAGAEQEESHMGGNRIRGPCMREGPRVRDGEPGPGPRIGAGSGKLGLSRTESGTKPLKNK
jgi:hypothetical protein